MFDLHTLTSPFSFLHYSFIIYLFCFADMATCFSQDKYAQAKGKKSKPLLKLSSPPLKKPKVGGSSGIIISSPVCTPLYPSPAVSIEELSSPPQTRKGKERKVRVFGQILLQPLNGITMSSLMTSLRLYLLFHLMSSLVVISTSLCRWVFLK